MLTQTRLYMHKHKRCMGKQRKLFSLSFFFFRRDLRARKSQPQSTERTSIIFFRDFLSPAHSTCPLPPASYLHLWRWRPLTRQGVQHFKGGNRCVVSNTMPGPLSRRGVLDEACQESSKKKKKKKPPTKLTRKPGTTLIHSLRHIFEISNDDCVFASGRLNKMERG